MKNLFIDRRHIQRLDRVDIRFHHPCKDPGPVLAPEKPWEGDRLHLWSAPVWCAERSRWRLWYIGGDELLPLYAESKDGLHWERPCLGRIEWESSRNNNIVNLGFPAKTPKERRLVLLRDDDDVDAARRFKALTRVSGRLIGLVSADGLDWTLLPGAAVPSNDEYRLGYDALHRRFVATAKGSPVPEFGRAVSLSTSPDFVEWTPAELVFWADEIDQQQGRQRLEEILGNPDHRQPLRNQPELYHTDVYNMPVFTYEGIYLGLPVIFHQSGLYWYAHPDDAPPALRSNQDGILYPTLTSSTDLRTWERCERAPFIDLSPLSDDANYDHGAIHACPPVISGDELWFYYYGARFTHLKKSVVDEAGMRSSPDEPMGALYRARLRLDGFASLAAGPEPGVALTRPVRVDGPRLTVNADASGGELRAEIRDAHTGRIIPGYGMGDFLGDPCLYSDDGLSKRMRFGTGARFDDDTLTNDSLAFTGNSTAAALRWRDREHVAELQGRMVRVCFYLREADLYAFWFGA